MKHEQKVISIPRITAFQVDPTLTSIEAMVLRSMVAGKTDKQVCSELRMSPGWFLQMMRDLREKTGTANNFSLLAWARRQMHCGDQRIGEQERNARSA